MLYFVPAALLHSILSCRRPTQYNESEVYVCESLFDEGKRLILPLVGGAMKR